MKRMHIHVSVDDLDKNIGFYSALFGAEPTVQHDDYAKWRLDDPLVNFAISNRGRENGVNHLGLEVESDTELEEISARLNQCNIENIAEKGANCCYAESDKYWTLDPQGIPWENFHTLSDIPMYGADAQKSESERSGCCVGDIKSVSTAKQGCC
ncbi:MAG TPA: glyoxalase/bleomycin resistance/dioxygenase family protein [Candidatus Thioglobus sp.]|jgi:catechol 2,3-dioxygenase-like lactoylglutathione lyase family enzyme|nr:glyoxalase/bleomycin resistance/dioxygenase family protein [Candidatus Thioglobus sp.]HIL21024.1 glyoxalase/bleomycin resistance/dioxygenase family protein [Candidatus Thioglobus sp.]